MQFARAAASAASTATERARGASVTALLSSDPDKTHDYKVKGVAVDSSITEMKDSLRRLRTTLESAATFYAKYAEPPKKPSTTTSAISAGTTSAGVSHSLSLPELAEWPKHELFCGSSVCSEQLFLDASRLAVIEDLMVAERSAIGSQVVSKLREGVRMAIESLEGLYAFELQLRDATHALEAAQEALKRGGALADIAEAQRQMKRLQSEAKPVALDTARARRQAAETGPICDAATTLANAYHDFVRGSTAVVHQQQPSVDYNPSVVRKAPKKKDARFAAYIMQWTLAKRRCKSSAALLEEFVKRRIETLLAPLREEATLEALAAQIEDEAVKARIEVIRLPESELSAACGACRTAVATLVDVLGVCRQLFKAGVGKAEEYEKKAKALMALQAMRDATYKEVVIQTERPEWLGKGKDVSKKYGPYDSLKLACAWKVDHPRSRSKYTAGVERVQHELELLEKKGKDVTYVPGLPVKTARARGFTLSQACNEVILLHGTNPDRLLALLSTGLNERFSGTGAGTAFGDGVYLAEDAGKTDQYVSADSAYDPSSELHKRLYGETVHHPDDVFYTLVVRAALGYPVRTQQVGQKAISMDTREPIFPISFRELSAVPGVTPPIFHHSLIAELGSGGGTVGTGGLARYREFVIFHSEYVHIDYLIAYHRCNGGEKLCTTDNSYQA